MAQWLLQANGYVIPRCTCRPLKTSEIHSEVEKKKRQIFNELIVTRWGTAAEPPAKPPPESDFIEYEDEDEQPRLIPELNDPVDNQGNAINQQPAYDKLIHAELVVLPQGETLIYRPRRLDDWCL